MREAGIRGCCRGRKARAAGPKVERMPAAPDLVERNFAPQAPDRLWVADITYVPTWSGWLYLAFVVDAFSRRVVGWSMATHLRTELVVDALNMALWRRGPQPGLIHHSDHGSKYASVEFGKRLSRRRGSFLRWVQSPTPTRQRFGRVVRSELEDGVVVQTFLAYQGVCTSGYLRVHRDVLQPEKEALSVGVSKPDRV